MGDIGVLGKFMYFAVFRGRQIYDSENRNGHAWLSATRLEGICMQLMGWGKGCLR